MSTAPWVAAIGPIGGQTCFLGELPGAAGLSRARKPLALPVAVVVGQPGVEVARAKPTSARTHEAIEGSARSDAELQQTERPILSRAPRAVLSEIGPAAAEPIRPA